MKSTRARASAHVLCCPYLLKWSYIIVLAHIPSFLLPSPTNPTPTTPSDPHAHTLAITGMVTAALISLIMAGSDMRATPPSRRMSAGMRSSAMTATAPASSAILACSTFTTSAGLRVGGVVGVKGKGAVVDTMPCPGGARVVFPIDRPIHPAPRAPRHTVRTHDDAALEHLGQARLDTEGAHGPPVARRLRAAPVHVPVAVPVLDHRWLLLAAAGSTEGPRRPCAVSFRVVWSVKPLSHPRCDYASYGPAALQWRPAHHSSINEPCD